MTSTRLLILSFLGITMMSITAFAQQPPYIVAVNGEVAEVEKILAKPDGTLVVTINGQPREIARNQYTQAVGTKPPEFDAAVAQINSGDYEGAAPALQEILRKSAYQSWDALAGKNLMEGALSAGKTADAARINSQLETRYGDTMTDVFPELLPVQWKLRIAEGKTEGLEEDLTTILREDPSRVKRGLAQVARGDLKRRRKDFPSAVLDYLRAVYFYSEVAEVHAEALYKTAVTFADIGDTGRLRTYQQELKETYPDSRFAAMPIDN